MVGTSPSRQAQRLSLRLIAVAGLLAFFALALGPAVAKSITNDEPVHLTRGVLLRQSADLSMQAGHTPLAHWLIGSLTGTEHGLPRVQDLDAWPDSAGEAPDRPTIAGDLLWRSGVDVDRLLFLGRLPIIWSALVLGAALALWTLSLARDRQRQAGAPRGFSAEAAALATAMVFFATASNLLASAALATTDMVSTVTYVLAVCAWWFYWQRPSRSGWLLTGVLLGLGLAAKLTGILLAPLLLMLAYVYYRRGESLVRPALLWLGLLPVAGLTLWLVYGFQIRPVPLASYWTTWATVLHHVATGHQSFFLGQVSGHGWWSYFPVTLLIKTPLPVLLLGGASLAALLWARQWRLLAFLLLPIGAILSASITSKLNIGYRHILPALPFLILVIGAAVPRFWTRAAGRWAVGLGLAWATVSALWVHPNHLAYFNELVGGPAQGYRYLGDSNLDWGQDMKLLAAYGREVGDDLRYSYSGVAEAAYYGLAQPPLTTADGEGMAGFAPANPGPGRYAISASHWQGILADQDLFDWFHHRRPDGSLGYSILLYDVDAAMPGGWIASCLDPGPLLDAGTAEALVGREGVRHLVFDCAQSWPFPIGPGWYILPLRDDPWWIESRLPEGGLLPVYEHRATERAPDYAVYYWAGDVAAALDFDGDGATTASGEPLPLPAAVGGLAALEGYRQDGTEWLTLWRVMAPTTEPLSMQAHLLTGGEPLVADSLGYPADQWQPGDRFVQRFAFESAPAGAPLETGLYNYATLEAFEPIPRLRGR